MQKIFFSIVLLVSFAAEPLFARLEPARLGPRSEERVACNIRRRQANIQTIARPPHEIENNNGDQEDVPDFAAMFAKLLEHDPVTGQLTVNGNLAYRQMVKAINTGKQAEYNAIELSRECSIV